ncbi:MAG TPA: hypothetical protein VGE45_19555 [Chloroflexia bacterium]
MQVRWTVWLLVIGLALLVLPLPVRASSQVPLRCWEYPILDFAEDKSLGHTIVFESVSEKSIGPNEPYWEAHPCMLKYQFSGYPYPNALGLGPTIYVIPVRDTYASLYPHETYDSWLGKVQALRDVLSKRPAWQPPTWQSGEVVPTAPLLPVVNAANVYLAGQKYMSFRNGSGVRYISEITQDASAPSRDDTSYMFQGIVETDYQGRHYSYYISAVFPAWLAQPTAYPSSTDNATLAQLLTKELGEARPAGFNPDLDKLDRLVSSFAILYPLPLADPPGMPDAGSGSMVGPAGAAAFITVLALLVAGMALRFSSQRSSRRSR